MPHLIALLLASLLLTRSPADGVEQQLLRGELKGARLVVCVEDVDSGSGRTRATDAPWRPPAT
jgi:hypothetical protein